MLLPATSDELAALLREAASKKQTIALAGRGSKRLMAGPIEPSDLTISIAGLDRMIEYEPRDLTVSVGAGMLYSDLTRTLKAQGQMIPLDPGFGPECTVGGVIAADISGPRRRLYGTARDMVIGMKFVTLEGQVVETGGRVVKNVAGLDMAKLLIGSFGTLAAIASVNFRLHPIPPETRTFVIEFNSLPETIGARDAIHKGPLQPAALDIIKDAGKYQLLIRAGGNKAVMDRYARELPRAEIMDGDDEERLWAEIREFTPAFLRAHPNGAVVRVTSKLTALGEVLESLPSRALARAGSGVCYGYFDDWHDAIGRGLLEYAPDEARGLNGRATPAEPGFVMMKRVKDMLDPLSLLNRGRLYGYL